MNSFNIYEEDTNKYVLDEENIAEFTFDAFMPQIEKCLRKKYYNWCRSSERLWKTYSVIINNEALKLYIDENQKEKSLIENSTSIFFKKLNNSKKSNFVKKNFICFMVEMIWEHLLDEKQFEIIKERYKGNSGDIPYLP